MLLLLWWAGEAGCDGQREGRGAAAEEAAGCWCSLELERRCREICKQCPCRAGETWVGCQVENEEAFLLDESNEPSQLRASNTLPDSSPASACSQMDILPALLVNTVFLKSHSLCLPKAQTSMHV